MESKSAMEAKSAQVNQKHIGLAYSFIRYVWYEASNCNRPHYDKNLTECPCLISFKDGHPEETFYDAFNAKFDSNKDFVDCLKLIIGRVADLGPLESQRMGEMTELITVTKKSNNAGNRGLAMFKLFSFYAKN